MYAQYAGGTFPYARDSCAGATANVYTQLLSGYVMRTYGASQQKSAVLWSCPNDTTKRYVFGGGENSPNSYAAVFGWNLNDDLAKAFTWDQDCPGGKYAPG